MRITYRPEIDGLRAIAVGAVILYHAKIIAFGHELGGGGFIGVDIFFVISGYLITSIILKEFITTGSFSFKNFYQRRIKRILPVLLLVMLVLLPFAWFYFIPESLIDFSKSILFLLGFSSNFYFWYSGQQYADENLFKPFLHTWSLSLEEQFYIFFPIVLFIILKYFRKFLIYFLFIALVMSLLLADWSSKNYPSFNFYILPTRLWELLSGSILGYFEVTLGHRSKNKVLNLILPSIGLILIGHSILFFNDQMFHPSFFTLSPIIGVCLIIWFSQKDELITKIFSSKLFVGIGLISYSLYLWHYPIFTFARMTEFVQGSLFKKLLLMIMLLLLSVFSYYFIEQPARKKKYKFKNIFLIIISIYFTILTLNILPLTNKFKNLFFDKNLMEFDELKNARNYWEKCQISHIKSNNYCKIGNSTNKVFLIGDSHLIPLIRNLGEKLNKNNYELNVMIEPGFLYRRKLRDDKREIFLKNIENSTFIFGGYYQRENKDELSLIYEYYKKDFELFLYNNNNIIFLTPVPELSFVPDKDLFLYKKKISFDISIDKKEVVNRNKYAVNFINSFNDIFVVYLNDVFCDKTKCYAINPNKVILKSDFDHPSLKGSEMINDLIMKVIKNIELKSN